MRFQPAVLAALAALTFLFMANDVMAQRGGWGTGGKLEYLNNPDVQKELDLVDEQVEDLKDIGTEAREVFRNAFSGMRENFRNMSGDEREEMMAEMRAKIQEDMKSVEDKVGSILVPHQMERLEQIVLQGQMRRGGTAAALQSEAVREKLGLTEEEAEKLKKKEEEVKKELEEQIKKLRAEAQDKILSVLPAEKRKNVKEMLGDAFEMQQNRQRGGRGGDRGGRGGDRGDRGGDRGDRGGRRGRG